MYGTVTSIIMPNIRGRGLLKELYQVLKGVVGQVDL
jgi:hypothetical protein